VVRSSCPAAYSLPQNLATALASPQQGLCPVSFHKYETFTFYVLPVVLQFRLARLQNPDRDKLRRSSVFQTTRKMRICGFYLFSHSRKCTEIPRIQRRWKDHEVTQLCHPCAPHTLYQHCPLWGHRPCASQAGYSHFISLTHIPQPLSPANAVFCCIRNLT